MQKSSHLKARARNANIKSNKTGVGKNISHGSTKKNTVTSTKNNKSIKKAGKINTTKDSLTKSFLETAAQKSMEEAAEETIEVMGYNVIAQDGWVVKVFKDKHVEKISPIPQVTEKN
jgi:hypothetical protein